MLTQRDERCCQRLRYARRFRFIATPAAHYAPLRPIDARRDSDFIATEDLCPSAPLRR